MKRVTLKVDDKALAQFDKACERDPRFKRGRVGKVRRSEVIRALMEEYAAPKPKAEAKP